MKAIRSWENSGEASFEWNVVPLSSERHSLSPGQLSEPVPASQFPVVAGTAWSTVDPRLWHIRPMGGWPSQIIAPFFDSYLSLGYLGMHSPTMLWFECMLSELLDSSHVSETRKIVLFGILPVKPGNIPVAFLFLLTCRFSPVIGAFSTKQLRPNRYNSS